MRRKNREITGIEQICEIINGCKVFRLAMAFNNDAYIVPLNFGYEQLNGEFTIYFHCAAQGKKLDMLQKNNHICFEMDCSHKLTKGTAPCEYGFNYSSVIGKGTAHTLTSFEEKAHALQCLMLHQTGESFSFTQREVSAVTVCKIIVQDITAKAREV